MQDLKSDSLFQESGKNNRNINIDETEIPDNVHWELNVPYGEIGGRVLTLDMFTPKVQPSRPRPAIVFLHGGGWMCGSPRQFHYHCAYLAGRYGFFAVSSEYRLSGEAKFPAALKDAKCAVRWVRSQCDKLNIDSNRIAICGASSGAHLASMVLTTADVGEYEGSGGSDRYGSSVNLGILFNGEFDMFDLLEKGSLVEHMKQFIGKKPQEAPELYEELSSINKVNSTVSPVLLLHGREDECVSYEQSLDFCNKLKSFGVHSEIEIYEGKAHAWFNQEPDRTITTKRMEKFLVEQFNLE